MRNRSYCVYCTLVMVVAALVFPHAGEAEPGRDAVEPGERLASDDPSRERPEAEADFDIRAFRERLRHALVLTDDQTAQLRELRAQLQVRLEQTREDVSARDLRPEEGRAQIRRIMNAHRTMRNAILSPDQVALLERAHRYLAERRLATPRERPQRGRRLERLAEALQLTPEQVQDWRALLERQRAEMQSLRETEGAPTREDVPRLRLEHKEAFEALLTPEQLARFREVEDRWHRRGEAGEGEPTGDEFGLGSDDEPATAVEDRSWGDIKEESR